MTSSTLRSSFRMAEELVLPTATKEIRLGQPILTSPATASQKTQPDQNKIEIVDGGNLHKNVATGDQHPSVLPTEQYEQADLCSYVHSSISSSQDFSRATTQLLGPLVGVHSADIEASIARDLQSISPGTRNSVADFDCSGATVTEVSTDSAHRLWFALKCTNTESTVSEPRRVLGRVVQIRSLTPIITLQLLVCLGDHFDMDRLFSTFLSQGPSRGYHLDPTLNFRAADMWYFSMKYYYLATTESEVYLGQISGPFHEKEKHRRLCHGSSSIALQFADDENYNSLPYYAAPWRLLITSCNKTDGRSIPTLRSGVEAYLWGMDQELTAVRRNLRNVADQISRIAVPSDDFLFNSKLRESLLFEDESYSNSRTYFWALQSLRIINDCIDSLVKAWEMSNASNILGIWEAEQEGKKPSSIDLHVPAETKPPGISTYFAAIEKQMSQLKNLIKDNNAKQEDIIALRDGLFNASAVLEARTAVTQGQNIRILTYISMLFLPASFVTSIFGMQSILPVSTTLSTFAVVVGAVCGPTYLLILLLSWRRGREGIGRLRERMVRPNDGGLGETKKQWFDGVRRMKRISRRDTEKGK